MSDCGRYLITLPQQDCSDNLVFFTDLQALPDGAITGKLPLTQVIFKLEHDYEVRIQYAFGYRTFTCPLIDKL